MSDAPRAKNCCPWALGVSDAYLAYHDNEWGVPSTDDATQFEFLILESAQAGLSWSTILHKREGYRAAFANFDPVAVARFDEQQIEALCSNAAIVRNRAKINAAVNNAKCFLEIQAAFGSFSRYIWDFVEGRPIQNHWALQSDCPATSPQSDALSKDLKKRGFKFVGSTTIYAHMQATGMINDHVVDCERHQVCAELGREMPDVCDVLSLRVDA